jgi:hypothetical protein
VFLVVEGESKPDLLAAEELRNREAQTSVWAVTHRIAKGFWLANFATFYGGAPAPESTPPDTQLSNPA